MTFVFPTSMPGFDLVKPDSLNGLKKGQIPEMPVLNHASLPAARQADGGRPVSDQGQLHPERGPGEPQASPRLTRTAPVHHAPPGFRDGVARALMDAAHKSLADALRHSFGLVQIGMVVLAALYVLASSRSVKQNDKASDSCSERSTPTALEPGFQFQPSRPPRRDVKVSTTQSVGPRQRVLDPRLVLRQG